MMSKNRKLLFVNPFSQPISGPDESLLLLVGQLSGEYDVTAAIPHDSYHAVRYSAKGAKTAFIKMESLRRFGNFIQIPLYLYRFASSIPSFLKLIKETDPDIVHTNMESVLSAGIAAKIRGVPHIHHVRSTSIAKPKWACDMLIKAIDIFSDRIITNSEAVAELFYKRGLRQKVAVVYNGVDIPGFNTAVKSASFRKSFGISESAPLIGTACRINPRKGLEFFIKAAALVKESIPAARFVIIGEAFGADEEKYRRNLTRLSEKMGTDKEIIFTGRREDVKEAISALDVVSLSSLDEGFGRVLIEAMALGKPVVSFRTGGAGCVIEDGVTGMLVALKDARALAEGIIFLLNNRDIAGRMGLKARECAESKFSSEKSSRKIKEIYHDIFSERQV